MTSRTGRVLQGACFALGPIAGAAPLGFAPLLHLTGLATLIAYRLDHERWPVPRMPALAPLCLLAIYIAASCLWTTAPVFAWVKLPELLALAASGLVIPVAIRDLPEGEPAGISRALVVGLPIGLLVCFGDLALGGPMKRAHKHWTVVTSNAYDREVISLGLLLWPAALGLSAGRWKRLAVSGLIAYTAGILFLQSHSAMVGMALGLAALGLSARFPRLVRNGLIAICAAGFASCIPAAFLLFDAGADHWTAMQFSFRHRVEIWHFTAERILHHPLFGLGLESSRNIPVADLAPGFLPLGQDKPPLHPHNFFLQIWLELGAVGCALTCFLLFRLIGSIRLAPQAPAAFTLGASVAFLAIASFAFGIWQGWWLALLVFLLATLLLASRSRTGT